MTTAVVLVFGFVTVTFSVGEIGLVGKRYRASGDGAPRSDRRSRSAVDESHGMDFRGL